MKKLLVFFIIFCISFKSFPQYLVLEEKVPSNWETTPQSILSISNTHSKLGSQSVKWAWKSGAIITITNPDGLNQAVQRNRGGMTLWIYNETAVDAALRFEFSSASNVEYWFDYQINFKGWRACWISFNEDMKGNKLSKSLNNLKIYAPENIAEGTVFFDRMIFPEKAIDHRRTPDAQLPFINPKINTNHWTALWHWHSTYTYSLKKEQPDDQTINELKQIEQKLIQSAAGVSFSTTALSKCKEDFNSLNIKREGNNIKGPAFVSNSEYIAANNDLKMRKAGDILQGLAKGWHFYKDTECRQMFIDLADHLIDQGWAVGSGMGTNHHYGYLFRKFAPSFLLMKDPIAEAEKLSEYTNVLLYWCAIPELREEPVPGSLQGLIDSWNTMTMPRLIAISMQDDLAQRDLDYRSFKRWMDTSLKYSPGTMGGIKVDGTGFHHGGLYPAYSNGGLAGLGEYLAITKETQYMLAIEAQKNLKQALSAMINYSANNEWGFGICGRHPLGGKFSNELIEAIGQQAACGNPETGEAIDKEMASAYLRLKSGSSELTDLFQQAGIKAKLPPSGFFTYNYGALGIHRRDNWMISLKGYNKYVWGSEIYTADNRFGRYQSYGTVQIMNAGNPVSSKANGFSEAGWDWNRFPGATVIHLPLELLESPYPGTLMEKSDETFAGALSLQGMNGIFGFKLKEKDRPNFTPDFVARKSVFCFNDHVICLGTGISNSNQQYPTETILFQTALKNKRQKIEGNNNLVIRNFPTEVSLDENTNNWFIDLNGNGYYLPKYQNVKIKKSTQKSKHNKTEKETTGNFAAAWIDHGKSPINATYEYAIWINSTFGKMQEISEKMELENEKCYNVLKKDNTAHIVNDRETGITGMVLFEAHSADDSLLVIDNSIPCLIMYQNEKDNKIRLSLANPDLNLPDNSFSSNLPARETEVFITLKGEWSLCTSSPKYKVENYKDGNTILKIICQDGIPHELIIEKGITTSSFLQHNSNFKFYPNPAKEKLTLSMVNPTEIESCISIRCMNGKCLQKWPLDPDIINFEINIENFANGTYLIGLENPESYVYQKLIVSH